MLVTTNTKRDTYQVDILVDVVSSDHKVYIVQDSTLDVTAYSDF